MLNVVTAKLCADSNFGCPSILHGIDELLKLLYGNEYTLTNIQTTPIIPLSVSDMSFKTEYCGVSTKQFLIDLYTGAYTEKSDEAIKAIKNADIFIDLYGIYFCYNIEKNKYSFFKSYKSMLYNNRFLVAAKKHRVYTVKSAASYGPIISKYNIKSAQFVCNKLLDVIVAREQKSKAALVNDAAIKKDIIVSPDIANLMPYTPPSGIGNKKIGISTSHQIIKQWKSNESYVKCIVELCKHINDDLNMDIVLIPNECQDNNKYNDIHVSLDIQKDLRDSGYDADILDVKNMTSTEIKNAIAACEVMIASRYHSCVAALSSGVPTFVIGWHYKYEELLEWYEQNEWILSQENCDSVLLIKTFDRFWEQRTDSEQIIKRRYPIVREAVIEAGRKMLAGVKTK